MSSRWHTFRWSFRLLGAMWFVEAVLFLTTTRHPEFAFDTILIFAAAWLFVFGFVGSLYDVREPPPPSEGLVVGFRLWLTGSGSLSPIASGMGNWDIGGVTEAHCGNYGRHKAPDMRCTCGLYLTATPEQALGARRVDYYHDFLLGACLAWGRLDMHSHYGARVEYARPILIAVDPRWSESEIAEARKVADRYGCRVVMMPYDRPEMLTDAAREYGRLMEAV